MASEGDTEQAAGRKRCIVKRKHPRGEKEVDRIRVMRLVTLATNAAIADIEAASG